jgi:pimeloyl-ACP methyl ester carboxylesterase
MKKKLVLLIVGLIIISGSVYFFFPEVLYKFSISTLRKAAGLEVRTEVVGAHTIHFLSGGKGEPIVMLHGFGADKDNWTRFSKEITPAYRVIIPDLPGFGESAKLESAVYATREQVEMLLEFAERLKLERFHIIGNSMGGSIAGRFAVEHPGKVLSLTLVAPGGAFSAEKSEFIRLLEKGENRLIINTPEEYRKLLEFVFVKAPPIPGNILRYLTKKSIENRPVTEKIFARITEEKYLLELEMHKIRKPVLIIWGDSDRILHVSGADILAKKVPGSKVVIMKNCGHIPMVERPGESSRHYLEFLKGLK